MFYLVIKFIMAGQVLGYAFTPTPFQTEALCEDNAEKLSHEVFDDMQARGILPEDEEIEVETLCTTEKPGQRKH